MCAGCAILAASAASGARSWLAAHGFRWLTPRRLKIATIVLIVAAFIGGSMRFSGSTAPPSHPQQAAPVRHSGA
jgi:hypothetical protein